MNELVSIAWGVITSILISVAKAVNLQEKWAFLVNLISAALMGLFLVFVQDQTWSSAVIQIIYLLAASYGTYKIVSKPIRELKDSVVLTGNAIITNVEVEVKDNAVS